MSGQLLPCRELDKQPGSQKACKGFYVALETCEVSLQAQLESSLVPNQAAQSQPQVLHCRELEEQLEEAVKLAEDAAQRRRHAEAQVVSLQADLESASALRGSKGISEESDSAFQLRMLQDLVQRQEDEVKEARALKSHARCAA